ncbi:LysR family transcriptional regulator [Kitasatospora sp. NPDC090091]|uniref:LysR family transcriptional regulator n=1 Tax=Kitasatospora sp. NPDC090091 TaxID=3364081 RepID=UPI003804BA48
MDTRRLALLCELSRLGSMRAVAENCHVTTSTVSQQLAALAKEVGQVLVEPDGRGVRLTPAGRRLVEHGTRILDTVEAARLDLSAGAEPNGTVRVAGYLTAVRDFLLPLVVRLSEQYPRVRLLVREHEPPESLALLADDAVDLALTYDYNLAPAPADRSVEVTPLWSAGWVLAVPAGLNVPAASSTEVFAACAELDWIANSRHTADETVVRTLASMAGFTPRVTHRADSLDLVQHMVAAGLGVALLPADRAPLSGVRIVPLGGPPVVLRAYAVARPGRLQWPALALVRALLQERAGLQERAELQERAGRTG